MPESELGGEVYRLVRHVLDALEEGAPAPLATRYFEAWLLRFAGVLDEDEAAEAAEAGARGHPEAPLPRSRKSRLRPARSTPSRTSCARRAGASSATS